MDNASEALGKMAGLVTTNTKAMSMLGGRAMVLGAFFDAALPHLSTSQCAEVARSFRQGIEDAMARMDDVALPGEYHSALLGLTNTILAALSRESATRQ
ncbi:hypothetical protein P3T23_001403 [Paraburkholderia sp. GAS448]|uniref:hypothetical protein n=1 Tax=Paraburkholderia sp. GAS448 TaxID=3035136 RepID=UPI003D1FCB93